MIENGLSHEEIAVAMGVTRQTIYHYLGGNGRKGIDNIKVIMALRGFCEKSGMSATELLGF